MIPRRLHLWWDSAYLPSWVTENVESWQKLHPTWDVHLWRAEPVLEPARGIASIAAPDLIEDDQVRHLSNVVRWYLLSALGGVWSDCDTIALRPLDPLLDDPRPFCSRYVIAEATVVGGPAAHPLWEGLLQRASLRPTVPQPTAPWVSGAHALQIEIGRHDVRVLPAGTFFDRDALGQFVPEPPTGRYCTHQWRTSTQRLLERDAT